MSPSSPSALNPFAASFYPPNKSLLQPHASSSACDVASLASLFSPLNSPNNLSFSLEQLVLAVISAYSHGLTAFSVGRCTQSDSAQTTSSNTTCQPRKISSDPESPSPSPVPTVIVSPKLSPSEFSALKGVLKSAVSGHPLIAPALNTNKNTATFRTSPINLKPAAQTHFSSSPSSSPASSSWKTVSPKRQHSHSRKPAVLPTLNTTPESKRLSIPLKNSFAALATDCVEPESITPHNATIQLSSAVAAATPLNTDSSVRRSSVVANAPISSNTPTIAPISDCPSNSSSQSSSYTPVVRFKFKPELLLSPGPYGYDELLNMPLEQLKFEYKEICDYLDDYKKWLKENRSTFTKEQLELHSKFLIFLSKYHSDAKNVFNSRCNNLAR